MDFDGSQHSRPRKKVECYSLWQPREIQGYAWPPGRRMSPYTRGIGGAPRWAISLAGTAVANRNWWWASAPKASISGQWAGGCASLRRLSA